MTLARELHTPEVYVHVTAEVIEKAERRNSGHCMVSDAVKACVPWARNIATDLQTIRFSHPERGRRYIYLTPRSAQVALLAFDQGESTKPFSFRLKQGQAVLSVSRQVSAEERARGQEARARRAKAERAELAIKTRGETSHNMPAPNVVGGVAPPVGALAHGYSGRLSKKGVALESNRRGQRRSFGLRSMLP
jgi:hypothetical protein